MTQEKKKNGLAIFLDELSRSSFMVTLLAIVTGLLLGGLLAAVTTIDVYTAMKVSFWEGIKVALSAMGTTFYSLFKVGFTIRPINKILCEALSLIIKINGLSARKTGGGIGIDIKDIPTPVAAAASVPSSFTSTNALCITAEINKFF